MPHPVAADGQNTFGLMSKFRSASVVSARHVITRYISLNRFHPFITCFCCLPGRLCDTHGSLLLVPKDQGLFSPAGQRTFNKHIARQTKLQMRLESIKNGGVT